MVNKRVIETIPIIAFYVFFTLFFSITLTLGNQEISNPEISNQITLFTTIFITGLIITISGFIYFLLLKKNNKYGDNLGFLNLGEKPSLSIFKRFSYLQITWLSLVIFGWLFFIVNLLKVGTLTGLRVLPQQFSPTDSLLFSSALIPGAEEMLSLAVMVISIIGLWYLARRIKLSSKEYGYLVLFLVPFIVGAFAYVWHLTAYDPSDYSLGVVFAFWTVKTFLVLLTGFFIVGFIMHFYNNFFIDFSRLFNSDIVVTGTAIVLGLLTVGYWYFYRGKLLGSKNG